MELKEPTRAPGWLESSSWARIRSMELKVAAVNSSGEVADFVSNPFNGIESDIEAMSSVSGFKSRIRSMELKVLMLLIGGLRIGLT